MPEKVSYQAVIRNSSNELVTNTTVGVRISILQGSESGEAVYTETQLPTANTNGLVSLEIGSGTTADDFSAIDWANGPYFIKTETDPASGGGTNYTITGTSQILSVPYALHAKTAEVFTGAVTETDPVFSASDAANISASDLVKLENLSGVNTGDQDLSSYATQNALQDTASAIREGIFSNVWSTVDNHIFYDKGLVGIGTSSPSASLDIYDQTGYQFFNFVSEDNVYTTMDIEPAGC